MSFLEYQLLFCSLAFIVTGLLKTPGLIAYLTVFFIHSLINTFGGIYFGQVTFVFTSSVIAVLIFDRKHFFNVLVGLWGVFSIAGGVLFVLNIMFGNGNQLTEFSRWVAMIIIFFSAWGGSVAIGMFFLSKVKVFKNLEAPMFGFLLCILPLILMFLVSVYVPVIHANYVSRHNEYMASLP